jgi:hypothetical protein
MNKNEKQTQSDSDVLSNILTSTKHSKQNQLIMFIIL